MGLFFSGHTSERNAVWLFSWFFFQLHCQLLRNRAGCDLASSSLPEQGGDEEEAVSKQWLLALLDCSKGNIGSFTTCSTALQLQIFRIFGKVFQLFFLKEITPFLIRNAQRRKIIIITSANNETSNLTSLSTVVYSVMIFFFFQESYFVLYLEDNKFGKLIMYKLIILLRLIPVTAAVQFSLRSEGISKM